MTANKTTGPASFTLDGRASTDPDGTITSYAWTLNGAAVGTGPTLTVQRSVGTHPFTLTVTDNGGLTASDSVTVTAKRR